MEYMKSELEENMPCMSGGEWSIDHLALGDQMLFPIRLSVWLFGGFFDILFE